MIDCMRSTARPLLRRLQTLVQNYAPEQNGSARPLLWPHFKLPGETEALMKLIYVKTPPAYKSYTPF